MLLCYCWRWVKIASYISRLHLFIFSSYFHHLLFCSADHITLCPDPPRMTKVWRPYRSWARVVTKATGSSRLQLPRSSTNQHRALLCAAPKAAIFDGGEMRWQQQWGLQWDNSNRRYTTVIVNRCHRGSFCRQSLAVHYWRCCGTLKPNWCWNRFVSLLMSHQWMDRQAYSLSSSPYEVALFGTS